MPASRRQHGVRRAICILAGAAACHVALGGVATAAAEPQSTVSQEARAGGPSNREGQEQASQGQVIRTTKEGPNPENIVKPAAPAAPGAAVVPSYRPVTIRVDNTGVASWKYRNARNPPVIWNRTEPLADKFKLQFVNGTSGATVKVTLPPVAVPFVSGTPALNPSSLLGLDIDGARAEAQRLVNMSLTLAEQAVAYAPEESNPIPGLPERPGIPFKRLANYLRVKAVASDADLSNLIKAESPDAGHPPVSNATQRAFDAADQLLKTVERFLAPKAAPAATAPDSQPEDVCTTLPLDPPAALSPMLPSLVEARSCLDRFRLAYRSRAGRRAPATIAAGLDALEQAAAAINDYAARVKEATAPPNPAGPPPPKPTTPMELAQRLFGVKLDSCETKNGEVFCTPTLTLAPNAEGWVEGRLLAKYPAKTIIKFRVTFPFALETEQPTDQFGYFSLDKELLQSPTVAAWSATGSLSLAREPFYGADGAILDADHVYNGARTRQVRGTGRTALAFALGDRASGTIEMQFKNGTLGRKDEDLAVKANQYNFQVFGFTGTSLKFGKYLFAAPTDGLAISESGEGATVRYRWLGVSHILKRESQSGVADSGNDDHKVWLADVSNVAIPGWSSLRSLSFYALYGIDNTPGRGRRYDTAGGEASFGVPSVFVTGTVAYYHSRSRPHGGSPVRHADGSSWLARMSRSWLQDNKPARTFAVTVAGATGDQRQTADRFEGYLGENAAYAPDGSLFLTGIVPRLRLEPIAFVVVDKDGNPVLDKDGKTTPEFLEKGLSNRRFVGVTYSDQTFSPLDWLAIALRIPQKDVESRQSTLRLHHYSPSEQVLGTRVGSWEAQMEFLLESPKGIKYIVKYSRVFASGPLEGLFPKEPYALIAQCNVSLK